MGGRDGGRGREGVSSNSLENMGEGEKLGHFPIFRVPIREYRYAPGNCEDGRADAQWGGAATSLSRETGDKAWYPARLLCVP